MSVRMRSLVVVYRRPPIRILVVVVAVLVVWSFVGVALAAEPNVPASGHWIGDSDFNSTPTQRSIAHVTISDSSGIDDNVRVWRRQNRATGACPTTQGAAFGAGIGSYDAAAGDITGTGFGWCPSEGTSGAWLASLNYDEAQDVLTDRFHTYRRVDEPVYVGLVDPTQGLWHLRDGAGSVKQFFYGNPGDFPIMGDWNCDGVDTPGMYRQSDGFVYLRNSNTQGVGDIRFFLGNPGDVPLTGDFNNDGCDTVSIYRPSEARFFIINELGEDEGGLGAAEIDYLFGNPGDKPFVGDFDADGIDTVGLHRESTGLVYFRNSHSQGIADNQFIYGDPGDRLVAGDWIDEGADTPALFRPSNSTFYFRFTNTPGNANDVLEWGQPGWLPVAGHFGTLSGPLCDLSYPDICVPPAPPDLNCSAVPEKAFVVLLPDLHGFDGNGDGVGCET